MKIKSFLKDLSGIFLVKNKRQEEIDKANSEYIKEDTITSLAKELHPGKIKAIVKSIKKETKDSKRITFLTKDIPYFKAGTYLLVHLKIGNTYTSRAYSIISSPGEAIKNKEVSIIVKDYKNGFVSSYLNHELKENDEVFIEVGLGEFYLNKFRDNKNIVAIAGGAGITPFISIAKDIVERKLDYNLTILYGSDNPNEIICKKELDILMKDDIKVVNVISGDYPYEGEKGFINKEIIKKYTNEDSTFFFSGPKVMYQLILKELAALCVDIRRIRSESFPINDVTKEDDFDKQYLGKVYNIEVHQGLKVINIKGNSEESIATSLERNGLKIKTSCRGGSCGVCRIKILEGQYYIPSSIDVRRFTDREFNYVHSCSTYPKSDLKIKIPIEE